MSRRGRSFEYHIAGIVVYILAWMLATVLIWISGVLMADPLVSWSFLQSAQAVFIGITIVRAGVLLETMS